MKAVPFPPLIQYLLIIYDSVCPRRYGKTIRGLYHTRTEYIPLDRVKVKRISLYYYIGILGIQAKYIPLQINRLWTCLEISGMEKVEHGH